MPIGIRLEIRHLEALLFQMSDGVQRRGMLDGCCDDVLSAPLAAAGTENRGIGRLRAAGGERNFRRVGIQNCRDLFARMFQNAGCFDAHFMYA